jgi:rsbT co-antagonist protein RsbR
MAKATPTSKIQDSDLLRAFMDNATDFIYFKDTESRFIRINQTQAKGLGLDDPAEAIGKSDLDFFSPEHFQISRADELQVMQTGQPLLEEKWENWADGQKRWISTTKLPLRDQAGNIIGIFGITRDITPVRQAEVAERERLQQEIIEAQQRAIRELSSPVIPIMDRIIVLPLIGSIDSLRARDITRNLLAGISQHRAKVVILDITGVSIMDTGVVNYLNKTIQAARLKGAQTIVTGMSGAVAETIVDLGIDWSTVQALSDLQTGLIVALASLGLRIEADSPNTPTQPG